MFLPSSVPSDDPRLHTNLLGLTLRNPIILSAGTCGTLDEMADVLDLSRVGAIITKSITPMPRDGNPAWRVAPLRGGMINAIGLANVGLDHFLEHTAPRIASVPTRVIASVAGFSIEDYVLVAGSFDDIDALAAIEINVSCPNVRGGVEFGVDPPALAELVTRLREVVTRKPLIVKLSPIAIATPGFTMLDAARAAIHPRGADGPRGADALTIANTTPAMAIDVRSRRPRLGNTTGGLSGPGVHPIAVRLVHDVHQKLAREMRTPIIGSGGVMRWQDAAEFILAGASAVQIGTGLFADPRIPLRVARGLARWVTSQKRTSIADLVGAVDLGKD